MSDEAKLLLCYPDSLTKDHNSLSCFIDIKNFCFKTIDLNKTISLFYHFHPELKNEYKSFFSSLSNTRNISVHGSLPSFQKYELERIGYFSTKLFSAVSALKMYHFSFEMDEKTAHFLKFYRDEQTRIVQALFEKSRFLVKKDDLKEVEHLNEDWETMRTDCPVCKKIAFYFGETVNTMDEDGLSLHFECDSFECQSCELTLDGYENLELANMETAIDRDNDIDQWIFEHPDEDQGENEYWGFFAEDKPTGWDH
ncbi:MAG: hypothetical protein D3923_04210 [Candidatus Electrothrix sp. AR3]|nr:hypothetical protein [Candidatus Electrothrix sp. AR3]